MKAFPADTPPSLGDEELLAMARRLPEPVCSEARREEMRTAFLSSVRGRTSAKRVPAFTAGKRGGRLSFLSVIVFAVIVFAGIIFAATTASRQKTRVVRQRVDRGQERSVATEGSDHRIAAKSDLPRLPLASNKETIQTIAVDPGPSSVLNRRHSTPRAAPRTGSALRGEAKATTNVELAFARGWNALTTGQFDAAAEAFGRAASSRQDNALSEDACFWRGVALDRAHRLADARDAFEQFLSRYPGSDRTGEAAVMLGWLLLRAGDLRGAEARFSGALTDPVERVRRSARAGLIASEAR